MYGDIDERIKEKNRLCDEFAKEWSTYFHDNFDWSRLNREDAYLTIITSAGMLWANYAGGDIEGSLILLDKYMDDVKNNIAKAMKLTLYGEEESE